MLEREVKEMIMADEDWAKPNEWDDPNPQTPHWYDEVPYSNLVSSDTANMFKYFLKERKDAALVVVNAISGRMTGGDHAKILINDVPVQVEGPEYTRGFHIVIVDPADGGIQLNKVFDTYKSSEEFERWIDM